jgi:predicted DNA-binding antitoxin AbrB/MazE fold protein
VVVKVDAIFQKGVFKPVRAPELREGERVRLTIQREVQATPEDILTLASRVYEGLSEEDIAEVEAMARGGALGRLRAGIEGMNFCSSGPLPSRDESHDRS